MHTVVPRLANVSFFDYKCVCVRCLHESSLGESAYVCALTTGLDAHALWHAATAINTPLWYQFTTHDVTDARGTGESVAGSDRFRCFRSQAKMLVELEAKKENK